MTAKSLISIFPLTWKRHLLTFSWYKHNSLQMIRQKLPGTQTSYNAETRAVVSCCCGRVQPPNDVTQRLKRHWTISTQQQHKCARFGELTAINNIRRTRRRDKTALGGSVRPTIFVWHCTCKTQLSASARRARKRGDVWRRSGQKTLEWKRKSTARPFVASHSTGVTERNQTSKFFRTKANH